MSVDPAASSRLTRSEVSSGRKAQTKFHDPEELAQHQAEAGGEDSERKPRATRYDSTISSL